MGRRGQRSAAGSGTRRPGRRSLGEGGRLDDRLQIMVPEQMRTENPAGIATYSNFRRFNVQTDTAVAPDRP